MNNKETFNAVCRNDFYAFMQKAFTVIDGSQDFKGNWHLELISDKLEQCRKGKIKKLIINIPPRNLKSHCASVCFPAYLLGHEPNAKIVCISYAQDLANKLSRKTRKLMESSFYKNIFQTRLAGKNTENEFETTKNGSRYATSIDGTLTGDGGSYIIIDDPIKADEATSEIKRRNVNEWYNNTLVSRLNNKIDGVIILIMQRLHVDDLTGHLLKQDGWELLSLPAIAENDETFILSDGRVVGRQSGNALNPKLEPLEILEQQRKNMSDYNFSAQYQQKPIPEKGNIIDFELFKFYTTSFINGEVFQSWDVAAKTGDDNDYSTCITAKAKGEECYIIDVFRGKYTLPDLEEEIIKLKQKFQASNVIIEESPISQQLIQALEKQGHRLIKHRPQYDKITRANNISFPLKAGKIMLPENANWLNDFKTEIVSFPKGRHDDQVDAFTQLMEVIFDNNISYAKKHGMLTPYDAPLAIFKNEQQKEAFLDQCQRETGARSIPYGVMQMLSKPYAYQSKIKITL